jgi:hypothetical protein
MSGTGGKKEEVGDQVVLPLIIRIRMGDEKKELPLN